ncbi:MAG: hypothetical protein HC923_01740 [Myxococcales bacterium]|nr:hypothetical protein [Myxococcales bacterium]
MIRQELGRGEVIQKQGKAVRLLGDLDPRGKMARVLVEVIDPLDLGRAEAERRPLLLGSYVDVVLRGAVADRVAVVSREAIREGDQVYLMDADDRLVIQPVDIAWRGRDEVYVASGLVGGERVVTSRVPAPVVGMLLRAIDESPIEIPTAAVEAPR